MSWRLVDIPKFSDGRGSLCSIEFGDMVPFSVRRCYYIIDVSTNVERGKHAHKDLFQLMVFPSGSGEIFLHDGERSETFLLDSANKGLIIGPLVWREMRSFSPGSVCLVFASNPYDISDYIFDFEEFKLICRGERVE